MQTRFNEEECELGVGEREIHVTKEGKREDVFVLGVMKFLWGKVFKFIRIHKGSGEIILKCIPTKWSRDWAKNFGISGGSLRRESRETPRKVHRKR